MKKRSARSAAIPLRTALTCAHPRAHPALELHDSSDLTCAKPVRSPNPSLVANPTRKPLDGEINRERTTLGKPLVVER